MSLAIERARSPWVYVLAVLALVPVLTLGVWGVQELSVGSRSVDEALGPAPIAAPGWSQEDWVTSVRHWKGDALPATAEIAAAEVLVTELYDQLLLEPASWTEAVHRAFTPEAEAELAGKAVGWPEGISDVRIKSRRLELGVQSGKAERAIAHVRIRAMGLVSGRSVELWHQAQLWIEKDGGTWKIFAFDIRQSPVT